MPLKSVMSETTGARPLTGALEAGAGLPAGPLTAIVSCIERRTN
jgi:hypothetical protein